jgi:hypothetical protein
MASRKRKWLTNEEIDTIRHYFHQARIITPQSVDALCEQAKIRNDVMAWVDKEERKRK